jgi:hypothetical protein
MRAFVEGEEVGTDLVWMRGYLLHEGITSECYVA